jgi:hypothetical protein
LPVLVVSFFFLLKRFKGFGGGGGPAGCADGPDGAGVAVVGLALSSLFLLAAVSFLCFLKGLIFLKTSSGGGGGGGPPGGGDDGWLCANACVEMQRNARNNGRIRKYFSLAEQPFLFAVFIILPDFVIIVY